MASQSLKIYIAKSEKKNDEVELCPLTLVHAWWTGTATFQLPSIYSSLIGWRELNHCKIFLLHTIMYNRPNLCINYVKT